MRLKEAIEWIKNNTMDNKKKDCQACISKLAKYEDLEEQGYLITLPIRPDDICYVPTIRGIVQMVTDYVEFHGDGYLFYAIVIDGERDWLYKTPYIGIPKSGDIKIIDLAIGKTVFLSKEEAEKHRKYLLEEQGKELLNGRN